MKYTDILNFFKKPEEHNWYKVNFIYSNNFTNGHWHVGLLNIELECPYDLTTEKLCELIEHSINFTKKTEIKIETITKSDFKFYHLEL